MPANSLNGHIGDIGNEREAGRRCCLDECRYSSGGSSARLPGHIRRRFFHDGHRQDDRYVIVWSPPAKLRGHAQLPEVGIAGAFTVFFKQIPGTPSQLLGG